MSRFNVIERISFRNLSPFSLIKAREFGIMKRNMSRIYTKRPVCVNRQNFQSISIDDSLPALLLVPYGVLLSLAVLLFEKILHLLKFSEKVCLKI